MMAFFEVLPPIWARRWFDTCAAYNIYKISNSTLDSESRPPRCLRRSMRRFSFSHYILHKIEHSDTKITYEFTECVRHAGSNVSAILPTRD
jgi:hypothetical protein